MLHGKRSAQSRPHGVRPPVPLSAERIVEAAIGLIDDLGAGAFTIRNLARALDVYPTAIYHHVGDRHQLLGLIGAAWMREVVPPPNPEAPFEWLREMAHAYRRAAHSHPGVARLTAGELVNDTSAFGLAEVIAYHLEAAGLPADDLVHTYNLAIGLTVGFVDLELAAVPESQSGEPSPEEKLRGLDPEQFPTLHRHAARFIDKAFSLRWRSGDEAPLDESFDFVVELVIDALRARADG